ncbi:hypothetical protein RCL1_001495 [Eukaryota sp. TZLM3-RCL]
MSSIDSWITQNNFKSTAIQACQQRSSDAIDFINSSTKKLSIISTPSSACCPVPHAGNPKIDSLALFNSICDCPAKMPTFLVLKELKEKTDKLSNVLSIFLSSNNSPTILIIENDLIGFLPFIHENFSNFELFLPFIKSQLNLFCSHPHLLSSFDFSFNFQPFICYNYNSLQNFSGNYLVFGSSSFINSISLFKMNEFSNSKVFHLDSSNFECTPFKFSTKHFSKRLLQLEKFKSAENIAIITNNNPNSFQKAIKIRNFLRYNGINSHVCYFGVLNEMKIFHFSDTIDGLVFIGCTVESIQMISSKLNVDQSILIESEFWYCFEKNENIHDFNFEIDWKLIGQSNLIEPGNLEKSKRIISE